MSSSALSLSVSVRAKKASIGLSDRNRLSENEETIYSIYIRDSETSQDSVGIAIQ